MTKAKLAVRAKVLNCPFCGQHPVIERMEREVTPETPHAFYEVRCDNEECYVNPGTGYRSHLWAMEDWNRRTIAPAVNGVKPCPFCGGADPLPRCVRRDCNVGPWAMGGTVEEQLKNWNTRAAIPDSCHVCGE